MGSVYATWKGTCHDRQVRDELLGFAGELAGRNAPRWSTALPRPSFLKYLTEVRRDDAPPLPDIRRFDGEIAGRILIGLDVDNDREGLAAEAASDGVEVLPLGPEDSRATFLKVDRAVLRGLDFRLFDPRGLYPGEDRMSFVFLESEVPCLDGRLVAVTDGDRCRLSGLEAIREADWYLDCPSIHLRYYLEEWSDILSSWLKLFFVPDLYFWRYEDLPSFDNYRAMFGEFRDRYGDSAARRLIFDTLLDRFEESADEWIGKIQGM